MSSLRLALKQSLQESGQTGGNKKPRSNRNKGDKSAKRKKRRGDSPRKRGRPKGSSRGHRQGSSSPQRGRDSDDEEGNGRDHGDHYGHSSSEEENEFSEGEDTDEEEEEEGEEEGEEEEDEEAESDHHEEEEDHHPSKSSSNTRLKEDEEERSSAHPDDHQQEHDSEEEDGDKSDDEQNRGQHKLQKHLKHSAANKIQNQWKKKKEGNGSDAAEPDSTTEMEPGEVEPASAEAKEREENPDEEKAKAEEGEGQHEDGEKRKANQPKKKKPGNERGGGKGKTAKTVPPPEPEVLEWNRALPIKRSRRNVAQGLRVKVRFATKVKRGAKILKKKKWFGGRVSAVSKEGSKIRIKYDDGTAEISKFPDKDVVVCDAFNGQHQCDASKFQPPQQQPQQQQQQQQHQAGSMVMDEERASPPPPPKEAEADKKQLVDDEKQVPPPPPEQPTAAIEPVEKKNEEPKERIADGPQPDDTSQPAPQPTQTASSKPDEASKPASEPEAHKPTPTPTPPPKEETHKSLPVSEPMEVEIVRPSSPPVPEIRPPRSPPIPEIEMKPSPPTVPPATELKAQTTPAPPPPSDVAVHATLAEPASPGEIVDGEKEPKLDKPAELPEDKEEGEVTQAAKTNDSEKAGKNESIKEPSAEPRSTSSDPSKDAPEVMDTEETKPNASSVEEEEEGEIVDPSPDVKMPPPNADPVTVEKEKASEATEDGEVISKPVSEAEPETEPGTKPDIPVEKTAVPKLSLTIRLPNPNKDRRPSGTEPKSPRIKISKQAIQEVMQEEGAAKSQKQFASGRNSPKFDGADKVVAGPKKRRRSGEETHLTTDASPTSEPPTKRIHVQVPAGLEKAEELDSLTAESKPEEEGSSRPKTKRPSSGQSDEPSLAKTAPKGKAADDADDGPVKIVGRVSAKRIPLFSDEESDAGIEKPKPENQEEASVLQKPKPKPAKPASVHDKQEEEAAGSHSTALRISIIANAAVDESSSLKSGKEEVLLSSRNSAFDRKEGTEAKASFSGMEKTLPTEEKPAPAEAVGESAEVKVPRPTTPRDMLAEKPAAALATPAVRSGRRAAQQANERIVSTKDGDKEKEKELGPEGKKRKRQNRHDEDSESSNEDVNNWVQCFGCKKWRIIPNDVPISSLPDRWYCHLSVDPERNTCDAPEQTAKTPVVKKKKKRKKKRAEAIEAAAAGDQKLLKKVDSQQDVTTKERLRARSPTPKDEVKSKDKDAAKPKDKDSGKAKEKDKEPTKSKDSAKTKDKESTKSKDKENKSKDKEVSQVAAGSKTKPPRASPNSISVGSAESATAQQADTEPPTKKSKKTRRLPDEPLESIPEVAPPEVKKRGRKARKEHKENSKDQDQDQKTSSFHGSVSSQQGDPETSPDNVEWVQCDSCSKWRKLPPHISADELPDVWYCNDNNWNPGSASCDAPEDKADGQQDIGPASPSPSSGKLSYRNLIFGSGRKVNRPVSERTRAAESIFATPSDDSEGAYPKVMYANSSAFAPRGSRSNIIVDDENDHLSVFDLMHHSSLFAELRGASQSSNKIESAGFGKPFVPKFETIPRVLRQDVKDLILKSLGNNTLLGEEVANECQNRHWDNAPPSWDEARTFCTKDLVITLLCELVTEGQVQLVQAFGKDWTIRDWNPRYRLASNATNENAETPMPKSRCMKIAKPWKQHV